MLRSKPVGDLYSTFISHQARLSLPVVRITESLCRPTTVKAGGNLVKTQMSKMATGSFDFVLYTKLNSVQARPLMAYDSSRFVFSWGSIRYLPRA